MRKTNHAASFKICIMRRPAADNHEVDAVTPEYLSRASHEIVPVRHIAEHYSQRREQGKGRGAYSVKVVGGYSSISCALPGVKNSPSIARTRGRRPVARRLLPCRHVVPAAAA